MTRALVIVEAAHLDEARAMLLEEPFAHTPEQAAGTFVPAGSPSGAAPATHWWLSAHMRPESWAACLALVEARAWARCWQYDLRTQQGVPWAKLGEMGLQPLRREVLP